jgi:hypothetical protein
VYTLPAVNITEVADVLVMIVVLLFILTLAGSGNSGFLVDTVAVRRVEEGLASRVVLSDG